MIIESCHSDDGLLLADLNTNSMVINMHNNNTDPLNITNDNKITMDILLLKKKDVDILKINDSLDFKLETGNWIYVTIVSKHCNVCIPQTQTSNNHICNPSEQLFWKIQTQQNVIQINVNDSIKSKKMAKKNTLSSNDITYVNEKITNQKEVMIRRGDIWLDATILKVKNNQCYVEYAENNNQNRIWIHSMDTQNIKTNDNTIKNNNKQQSQMIEEVPKNEIIDITAVITPETATAKQRNDVLNLEIKQQNNKEKAMEDHSCHTQRFFLVNL